MFLGWNEFVAVLWNPIYLILGFLTFAFGWMLYSELDVDARMQQGWVSGALGIWSNLGDALRTVRRGPGACMQLLLLICMQHGPHSLAGELCSR